MASKLFIYSFCSESKSFTLGSLLNFYFYFSHSFCSSFICMVVEFLKSNLYNYCYYIDNEVLWVKYTTLIMFTIHIFICRKQKLRIWPTCWLIYWKKNPPLIFRWELIEIWRVTKRYFKRKFKFLGGK